MINLYKPIKKIILSVWRFPLKWTMRRKCKNKTFTIISSNSIGGCLLHDLGREFNTPTINLVIPKFVTFCENLFFYLEQQPQEKYNHNKTYPIMLLGDIEILGIHYKTYNELEEAWIRRTKRLLQKKSTEIFLMASDAQLKEENAIERFHNLPYRKVCFVTKEQTYEEFCCIKLFDEGNSTGDLTKYIDWKGNRIFEKYFDCVSFINKK